MLHRIVAVAVSIIAFTQIAAAADLAYKAPSPVAPVFTWTGWYIGANAGYDWNNNVDVSSSFSCPDLPCPINRDTNLADISAASSQSISAKGFNGGIQAGYNWQTGSLVLGIESDVGIMNLSGQQSLTITSRSGLLTFSPSTSIGTDALATVRGRLGWAVAPTVLLYGTGGLAVTDPNVHNTFSDSVSNPNTVIGPANGASSNERTRAGWTAGGGVEWAFAPHWSVKAEYLYADFGSIITTASVNAPNATISVTPNVFSTSVDVKANLVRVGINYLFQ